MSIRGGSEELVAMVEALRHWLGSNNIYPEGVKLYIEFLTEQDQHRAVYMIKSSDSYPQLQSDLGAFIDPSAKYGVEYREQAFVIGVLGIPIALGSPKPTAEVKRAVDIIRALDKGSEQL